MASAFYTYSIRISYINPLSMTEDLPYSCSAASVTDTMENVTLRAARAILAQVISC